MKSVSYIPDTDELIAEFRPRKTKPSIQIGHFSFWWDDKGNICAIRISAYLEEQRSFVHDLNQAKLGGIWKGISLTENDIKEAREELLRKLEEKW